MHSACVTRQVGHCEAELHAAAEAESARSQAEGLYNRNLVVQALTLKQRCGASQLQSLQSLQSLQEAGLVLPWKGEAQCSAAERSQAQALVGDIGKAKTHAMELAQNYALGAETLQLLALAGLDERAQYDASYLGQKQAALAAVPASLEELSSAKLQSIRASLQALNASLAVCRHDGARDGATGATGDAAAEQCELPLAKQMADMRQEYALLGEAYGQMKKEVHEYEASVHASVNAVRPMLQSAQQLASQLDPGFHIPSLNLPELRLTEVHLRALPSTREMRDEMAAYRQRQQARAGVYIDQAQSDASAWADEVGLSSAGIERLLADYDPPPVNTSKQRAAMRRASDAFLAEQEAALDGFAALRQKAANLSGGGGDNASFALPELSAASLVGFSFEPLHGADVDVDLMSLALGKVVWLATVADMSWRAYRTFRLVARYWSKAALAVPQLDLRGGAAARSLSDGLLRTCAADPCKLLGSLCLSPAAGVTLVALALLLVLNAAAALYVPTYLQYVDGCVTPPRNGTFFANNVYSVAYNYAAADGNKALLEGLDSFHSTRAANCSAELRGSAREQQGAQMQLDSVLEEHEAASADMRLLRKCLELSALGQDSSSRGHATLDTFNTLDLMLHSPACEVRLANATLHYAVYNCTALPDCEVSCSGPSREVTGTLCRRCGCHSEWYFHGMVLQLLLAIFVFLCINTWRVCLVDALCRLLWRELVAGEFEFVATCDERGVANVGRVDLRDALRLGIGLLICYG